MRNAADGPMVPGNFRPAETDKMKTGKKKIRVQRFFTKEGIHPFETVKWVTKDAILLDSDGKVAFRQDGVEVPETWNDTTINIVAEKYFRVVNGKKETSAKQMFHRVAYWMATQAVEQGVFEAGLIINYGAPPLPPDMGISKDGQVFYEELLYILLHGMYAFNSPVWFNVGVVEHPQCSACFIQEVQDEMGAIMDLSKKETMLFKGGSGSGTNFSNLRASIEKISGGGFASGPVSFMKGFDAFAGATKSGGTTRRAAKMVVLNADHPDVLEQRDGTPGFITCKAHAEQIAHDLYSTGKYTAEFNVPGNVYDLVSFQNANNSVRVTDQFMTAVERDEEWATKEVVTGNVVKVYRARQLWEEIAKAAWICGDPGLQFDTITNEWHTTPNSGRINASNPCQPAWATVLTKDGIRTFADIDVGSEIWSGKQWTKVIRKLATGVKPVYRFYTRAGIFAGTAEHRVISNGVRIEAQHAESIDTAQGPISDTPPRDAQSVVDGLVLGDGFIKICNDGADHYPLLFVGQNDHSYFSNSEVAEFINSKPFDKLCHRVNTTLTREELPKTYLRNVPARFLGGDEIQVTSFLRGLYSANGSVVGQRITLKAASFAVISQVQEMLSSLGIKSYYTTNKANDVEFENGIYTTKESYDLNISTDRDVFARLIGFIQPYKQGKLNEILNTEPAARGPKTSYGIVSKQFVGEEPVWDIEVEAEEHTYWTGGLLVSNCSEYLYQDDTACNLGSINLMKLVRPDNSFDVEAYRHICELTIIAKESIVDASSYPSDEITKNSHIYRTLGLGYTNLGTLLTFWGLPYDSNEGRIVAAALTAIMGGAAYAASARLAEVKGPFMAYENNKEAMLNVIRKHTTAAKRIPFTTNKQWHGLIEKAIEAWNEAYELGLKHGYRNAQTTLLAPTGTISFLMGARSTGIEPDLSIVVYKKLVGGGLAIMPNETVAPALKNLGYSEAVIEEILKYIKEPRTIPGYKHPINTIHGAPGFDDIRHGPVFAESLGAHALRPDAHVLMMGATQPFLSGGISKTVNLSNDTTVEDIKRVYMLAWKEGVKCVAVYRDGCKLSQPISNENTTMGAAAKKLSWGDRKKMPDDRYARTAKFTIGGTELYVTVGLWPDGHLGEIFVRISKQGSTLGGIVDWAATSTSIALQYGAPLEALAEKFIDQTFEPNGHTSHPVIRRAKSIPDLIFQWLVLEYAPGARHLLRLRDMVIEVENQQPEKLSALREAVKKGDVQGGEIVRLDGPPCTRCGNMTKRAGTCYVCQSCGTTSGCS